MGFTITCQINPKDAQAAEQWMADVEKAALNGNFWRKDYDSWDGFVQEIDDRQALITLKNVADPGIALQLSLGRHQVPEDAWERLGVGCWFQFEFTTDGFELKFL